MPARAIVQAVAEPASADVRTSVVAQGGKRVSASASFDPAEVIGAGLRPQGIQAQGGHASIVETMDTFGHLFPAGDDATRQALEDLQANPSAHAARER